MANPRLTQFAKDLHQEVLQRSGDNAGLQLREEAFTEYVTELLWEHNEADNVEICYHEARNVGKIPAAKLNAYSLSGDGATLDLFVSLYWGTGELEEVGLPETRKQFQLVRGFLQRVLDGMHTKMEEAGAAFIAAQKIYAVKDSLATVRLFVLTDGTVRSLDGLEQEPFGELEVRPVLWDLDKLSRLGLGHREVIALDFENDYGGSIPCIQTQDATGEYRTFLAYFTGSLLAKIYGQHGQRLLESNVRAFLQANNKVNRGLQKTLREDPHRFLAYNNGLCCTASDVKVEGGRSSHALLKWVKDFQLVNGGQTTASIFHALKVEKRDISQVIVQVKLTVIKESTKLSQIVPLISRYANSQNIIKAADFAANGIFHQQLEEWSRTVWAPAGDLERGTHWYYERARGSYKDDRARQSKGIRRREWETQNPKEQLFTKTDLAKFEQAWLGLPHIVCWAAQKNFVEFAKKMELDGEPSVDLNYFKLIIGKAIFWRSAEKLFDDLHVDGYRAASVAYAIAWMVEQSGRRIDLVAIWDKQKLTTALSEALKVACKAAWDFISDQHGDAGEKVKKDETWQDFRKLEIATGTAWKADLLVKPVGPTSADLDEALATEWEKMRLSFTEDARTIGGLEALTNCEWVTKRRGDAVATYAVMTWDQLRRQRGLGLKTIRKLIEMFRIAAQG